MINNGWHCFSLKCVCNPCCWSFAFADSHSGEWRGANIQPQPGRQHQQIPRYHLAHSQGNWQEHRERRSPGHLGEPAWAAVIFKWGLLRRRREQLHTFITLARFPLAPFAHSITHLLGFPCTTLPSPPPPVCSHPSLFKTSLQQLFGHLIVYPKLPFLFSSHTPTKNPTLLLRWFWWWHCLVLEPCCWWWWEKYSLFKGPVSNSWLDFFNIGKRLIYWP